MRSWTIDTYLHRLEARHPTPASSAVAALNLAQGAALLAMVARFRLGPDQAASVLARAEDVREVALRLAEADAEIVDEVAAAYALPRSTEAERAQRAAAIADTLLAAAYPPAELITVGAELVVLCERMAEVGSGNSYWPRHELPVHTPARPSHSYGDRRTLHNRCDSPNRCATTRQGCDLRTG